MDEYLVMSKQYPARTPAYIDMKLSGQNVYVKRKNVRRPEFGKFYAQNREIVRRAGILLLLILVSNIITACVTSKNVKAKLETEYQVKLQTEITSARQEIEHDVRLIYGADEVDAQTAQFNREVEMISKLLYPYLINVSDNSIRSGVWCVLSRVESNIYPGTIEDVILQEGQWMGYSDDNPVVQRISDIVTEQLRVYYSGTMPMNPVFTYLNWEDGEITLRDAFNGKYHIWDDSDWEALGYKED